MKVEKYELYYLTYLIADFYVDEKENITYVTFEENIVHIKDSVFVFLQSKKECSLEEFPFLKSRLVNMNKFHLVKLKYETDNYMIKKIYD